MTDKNIEKLKLSLKNSEESREFWHKKYYEEAEKRQALENWIKEKFLWWIDLLQANKGPCLKYLIKNTAEILGMRK